MELPGTLRVSKPALIMVIISIYVVSPVSKVL